MPVAGDAHFGKCEDFNTRSGGFERETLDDGKVVGLVVGPVMELNCTQLEAHFDPSSFSAGAMRNQYSQVGQGGVSRPLKRPSR
jgi:hypothetical protein